VTVTDYSLGMFEWASGVIARAVNQGILVHCVEGKNRSATLATGYLMKAHHLNREQATRLVTSRRPWASPDANALAGWEHHLVKLGLLAPRAGTSPAKTGKDSDEWIGHDLAVQLSMASLVSQVLFESAGTAIGLDKYLELHNASGAANNCLIYSLAGALGQVLSDERIAEIGAQVRKAGVGVEASGFLNAQAVPAILGHLGAAGRRVVIIDTTGKVTSPQIAPDEDTYSAEIVNASGGGTLVIVNQSNVHFGYAHLRDGRRCHAVDDDATDGNHWVQFTGAAMIPHPLGTQSPTTMHALAIMHLQPAQDLTLERIRAQYRKLALSLHPDKSTAPDAAERFKELRRAYGHLTGEDETASGEVRALQYQ
jgi:hypothetical protein